jgi:acyl-CoA thioester hydrolase
MSKHFSEARLRVRYAETDQMGVVYYSNYLTWMEVGRVEYCKSVGFNYRDMEREDGVVLAVVEAHCRYLHPARFDDEVIVKTWIEQAGPRLVGFGYEMRRAADDRPLARGSTRHIFCGLDLRPARLPARYHPMFINPRQPTPVPPASSASESLSRGSPGTSPSGRCAGS